MAIEDRPMNSMDALELGGTYSATLKAFQNDVDIRRCAKTSGVYTFKSIDRMLYVGLSSRSMTERIFSHHTGHSNPYLYQRLLAAQQYNETILLTLYPLEPEEAKAREEQLIYQLDTVYNRRFR